MERHTLREILTLNPDDTKGRQKNSYEAMLDLDVFLNPNSRIIQRFKRNRVRDHCTWFDEQGDKLSNIMHEEEELSKLFDDEKFRRKLNW